MVETPLGFGCMKLHWGVVCAFLSPNHPLFKQAWQGQQAFSGGYLGWYSPIHISAYQMRPFASISRFLPALGRTCETPAASDRLDIIHKQAAHSGGGPARLRASERQTALHSRLWGLVRQSQLNESQPSIQNTIKHQRLKTTEPFGAMSKHAETRAETKQKPQLHV